jgi:Raf kinase inhibitor-like YbhB/YbcL family protein
MNLNLFGVKQVVILLGLLVAGCGNQAASSTQISPIETIEEVVTLKLTSSAFEPDGFIPEKYTYKMGSQCTGENYSPPLEWNAIPQGTQSLLLTMVDPDGGNWVHWVLYNIPPELAVLTSEINGPDIGIAGKNDFGKGGYGGPCPPSGIHHYVFTLYALDTMLELKVGVTLKAVLPLIKDHILEQTSLTGLKKAK